MPVPATRPPRIPGPAGHPRRKRLPRPDQPFRTSRTPLRAGIPCRRRGTDRPAAPQCRRPGGRQRAVPRRCRLRRAPRRRLAPRHWVIRSLGRPPHKRLVRRQRSGEGISRPDRAHRVKFPLRRVRLPRLLQRRARSFRTRPRPVRRRRVRPRPVRLRPVRPRPVRPRPVRPRPVRPRPVRPRPVRLRRVRPRLVRPCLVRACRVALRRLPSRPPSRCRPRDQVCHRRRPARTRRAGQDLPGTGPVHHRAGPPRVVVRPRRAVSRAPASTRSVPMTRRARLMWIAPPISGGLPVGFSSHPVGREPATGPQPSVVLRCPIGAPLPGSPSIPTTPHA
jgi:hypothetical protein